MKIESPLSNISDVLRQIKASSELYKSTLESNEAATRAVLIDPVLKAFGWDIANADMVEMEKTAALNRADYVLNDENGYTKIVVEAKTLNKNLIHPEIERALGNYSFAFKPDDIFLTDGIVWRHYRDYRPGYTDPVRVVNLANDKPIDSAAYLVQWLDAAQYWSEKQTVDALAQQVEQLQSAVSTLQQELARLTAPTSSQSVSHSVPVLSTPHFSFTLLSALDTNGQKPTQLKLPDGAIVRISAWKDILRECCKFAMRTNASIPIPFRDRADRKVFLINIVKPVGVSYVEEEYNGRPVFIYLNYDAANCVRNAMHALSQVPAKSKTVEAGVAF